MHQISIKNVSFSMKTLFLYSPFNLEHFSYLYHSHIVIPSNPKSPLKGVTIVVHCKNTFLSKKMLFGQKFLHLFFSSVHYLFKTPQMTSKPQFCFFPDSGEHFTYLDHGQKVKIHQNMTKGSFLDKSYL